MKKKIVGILICMLLITNILCFPAIAIDERSNYEQDVNIEFIFAFGRVRDVEKYPEELFYQFRSVSLLIVWFYFYRIDLTGLMIDYSRGVAQGFQGFKFRGILTNKFIFGFFLPSQ